MPPHCPSAPLPRHISPRMLTSNESTRRGLLRSTFGDWLERLMAHTEEPRHHPALLPAAGRAAGDRLSGGVYPLRRMHRRLPAACADEGSVRRRSRRRYSLLRSRGRGLHCLRRHAVRVRLSYAGAHASPAELGRIPARQPGAAPRALPHLSRHACRLCVDACPMGEAALAIDAAGHPVLRREGCVGCGVCLHVCPTSPSSYELTCMER